MKNEKKYNPPNTSKYFNGVIRKQKKYELLLEINCYRRNDRNGGSTKIVIKNKCFDLKEEKQFINSWAIDFGSQQLECLLDHLDLLLQIKSEKKYFIIKMQPVCKKSKKSEINEDNFIFIIPNDFDFILSLKTKLNNIINLRISDYFRLQKTIKFISRSQIDSLPLESESLSLIETNPTSNIWVSSYYLS